MRIAYLASRLTLPGSPDRAPYAHEHDQMVAALRAGGLGFETLAWDEPEVDWGAYDAALIGSTWDYCERRAEFLVALEAIEARTPLFNSAKLARWNSHKGYLRELEARGVRAIPTLWRERFDPEERAEASRRLGPDLVIKRQVGASAVGQLRLRDSEPCPVLEEPVLIQAFMPAVRSEGELSFVFVDERLSHALVKRPRGGDYRVQAAYGGREEKLEPRRRDLEAAYAVLEALGDRPLYSRVDMVRGEDGALRLMELELVEPFLYPAQGPEIGALLRAALQRRLS